MTNAAQTALVGVLALAAGALAQTSSPTPLTPKIMRGPDWARLRTAMPDIIAGRYQGGRGEGPRSWNAAVRPVSLGPTIFEGVDRMETLFLKNVEVSSNDRIGPDIPRNLDYHLAPDDVAALTAKLRGLRIVAYDFFPQATPDDADLRQLFEFARSLKVLTIVAAPPAATLPAYDKLANEFGINVALKDPPQATTHAYTHPQQLLAALNGLSPRVGACADLAAWMRAGVRSLDALKTLGSRVIAVRLADGAADLPEFLMAMYRMGVQPSFLTLEASGKGDALAELTKSVQAYDKALQPIAGDRVDELSSNTPIRGPERLRPDDRAGVEAAVPAEALVRARKPRKLLVIDLNVAYPGHNSIPAANLAIELWGKKTGAYTAVLDNNLDNLKYPKIREFDAIFLNNTVGQVFPDPEIRASLMRFIREGGGLGGYHGAPHASMDWTEFGDMLAARGGSHRDFHEKATIKIDDPKSPLTAMFGGTEFEWQDEFFRFTTPPYDRAKVHVLLSFDAQKTDMHQKPDCDICDRADNDIAVAWIRSYGRGRIFYATIGHLPTAFETPTMSRFFLAGIQFVLGDLDADTTPGGKPVR
jgi:type 1 glutamine amidotransferase/sugar phosphate isomerase/epimerase